MPKFKDFNFKLAVIDQLMYQQKLLKPEFDVKTFVSAEKWQKIDHQKHPSRAIADVKKFFKDLEIPQELLDQVTILDQNDHKAYHQVTPYWDGEGNEFNITSTEDVKLLPNLKEVILFYEYDQKMVKEFQVKGIAAKYL
ncbi:hypothetical protein [Fluviicola sp.]|uniref:DUF6892 domain-containing protein n=1 Tax=Fluviicola sp. TaxID=1917219 RepID=UPI002616A387|nr:hypothetical protein [Fluviicola sp.]